MRLINMLNESFYNYLLEKGYKEKTPNGSNSTAYQYVSAIEKICVSENIEEETLSDNISSYIQKYDVGGEKEEEGNTSHRIWINALKRYEEFLLFLEKNKKSIDEVLKEADELIPQVENKIENLNKYISFFSESLSVLGQSCEVNVSEYEILTVKYAALRNLLNRFEMLDRRIIYLSKRVEEIKESSEGSHKPIFKKRVLQLQSIVEATNNLLSPLYEIEL